MMKQKPLLQNLTKTLTKVLHISKKKCLKRKRLVHNKTIVFEIQIKFEVESMKMYKLQKG